MDIKQAKNIYCLGIGGIGVSALARILFAMGKNVSGSDIKESVITKSLEDLGMDVDIGPNPAKITPEPDLVIYSQDIPKDDLDFITSPKISQAQALGDLMVEKYGIGVTGTNGKSTTTALLGLILERANLDPTVLIGSTLSHKNESDKFQANARYGKGEYLVVESDEYHRKMLFNKPKMIIVTNVAEDHLDYYNDLSDIKSAFLEYAKSIGPEGILIFNADDHNTVDVCKHVACHKFTFGIHHYADLQAVNCKIGNREQIADLHYDDEMIGQIVLKVPGIFNMSNALGAILAAIKLGVEFDVIKQTLAEFNGLWRRFEEVGNHYLKPVISDYAHHPAGVELTIQAAREFFPNKKILVVFQPHHRNRTKALFGDFVEALVTADEIILPEIFDVTGREHGEDISSEQLVEELTKKGAKATYAKDLSQTEKLIKEKIKHFDLVLMMGAGDIDNLARKMVK
ncbi:MAG: UDP-N-acetylmuramate--L-alanine ligase [Candidatus Doudnabacteria bacterium RIFCSPLOWO2_02_FULL_42_9]|uniref:UDP-N-acetylmuramate--L-alanine ligase n=1 Tax=Candidatus Doudnabacteria bacterium RIFCSPHIGHO2_01_FULL_41_86 TaxID=1817821 RepID=A0A1F5N7G2_9BACT|nr:MAG: UDP-N-acetylmuramate--L-alanine ligase [Candidatus Doudnabacteria bacterium RIFCSPHIGHO2_01_FULL_41_86]OGE75695.1 MAG: UDP-N-acetylmuramate--L-alanine ligase [Candidatus Doudnabacteria bacterium RIFCSPHIGHO2_01_43_10]OGE85657.1 MAG: UDP-N-acetylmuramate--L-alanine ligase [Candidatus Doudnabacteria bacterium RIFCSPHIGHO2_12_FULL_42_22]OGE87153.1 MAG: UDP-N-acetylmuramate--L-alanine ligase [Candidatus Doudnabacteria bacterium RIFCSPHIGHO2_02_FULL_42_25]OGE91991.1 MAG: UDP-N-acetylmuramate